MEGGRRLFEPNYKRHTISDRLQPRRFAPRTDASVYQRMKGNVPRAVDQAFRRGGVDSGHDPNSFVMTNTQTGKRYFNQTVTRIIDCREVSDNATTSKNSQPQKVFQRKRKNLSSSDNFISLNSDEPVTKQSRIDGNNNNDDKSSEFIEISSDDETPSGSHSTVKDTPYTVKEARRLFMKDAASSQIHDFFFQNHQKDSSLMKKQQLRSALEKVIRRMLEQDARLMLVGSSVNGFGRITSDADFCLIIDKHAEKIMARKRVMRILYSLQQLLRQAPFVKRLQVIPAKVPILKFVDSYTGMECDININNLTGIRNTELMKRYAMLDPRVQPLALVIKEWAYQSNINDASRGTLSSYSLVLMIIHFLQCGVQPPVLPSIQKDHPKLFDLSIPIMDVEEQANKMKSFRSKCSLNLIELLRKFFEYYAEKFDFKRKVISVRLGTSYDVSSVRSKEKEWTRPIKIEEPFDKSNTARALYSEERGEFIFKKIRLANFLVQRHSSIERLLKGVSKVSPNSVIVLDD